MSLEGQLKRSISLIYVVFCHFDSPKEALRTRISRERVGIELEKMLKGIYHKLYSSSNITLPLSDSPLFF